MGRTVYSQSLVVAVADVKHLHNGTKSAYDIDTPAVNTHNVSYLKKTQLLTVMPT